MIQAGHILIDGDRAVAVYRCGMISYPLLPARDKEEWLSRLAWFAYRAEADFSLLRVHRFYRPNGYIAQARDMLDPRHGNRNKWNTYLAGHIRHLDQLNAFTPELYVCVSLTSQTQPSESGLEIPGVARRAAKLIRRDNIALDALRDREAAAYQAAASVLPVRRATSVEIQWLFARGECRGVQEPPLDQYWRAARDAIERGTLRRRFAAAPVHEQGDLVVVEGRDCVSFQSMLAMGALPDDAPFPGGAEFLFSPFRTLPFPVDAAVHVRWLNNTEALKLIGRRVRDADIAYGDATEGGIPAGDYRIEENRRLARDAQDELQDPSHPPLLLASISLAVGAPDRDTLRDRVKAVRRAYGHVRLERPRALQALLYNDHLPGTLGAHVDDYEDVFTISTFGALMPIATHEAGSRRGAYVARVTSGDNRPVLIDITAPAKAGRPPAWMISGGLGSGKTMFAQLLAIQAALRGSRVVTIDPKPDHNLENVPELDGMVEVIVPSGGEEHRGMLDPLVVAPQRVREDRANSYYGELLAGPPMDWVTQIRKAVKAELADSRTPCSLSVIDRLKHSPHPAAQAAGEALEVWADSGMARLGFGNGIARHEAAAPVITIRPHDLALPLPTTPRAAYDDLERMSVATLKLIAGFALRLLGEDTSIHKLFVFDEAGVIVNSADGLRLVAAINLYGRTKNATLVLLAQLAEMVGDLEKLVGTRLVLGQESLDEARRGLQLLGLDQDDRELAQKILGFRRGRGIIRDVDGNIAEVQIDLVHDGLVDRLDTSPKDAAIAAATVGT